MSKARALVLFSGGLDSMLAAKVLLEQGMEVMGLTFESNFFNADKAIATAEKLGLKHKIVDIRAEELALVKNPPSGYGKNLNPCIDCHSLMIKKAGQLAKEEGFAVVASGEVLGQRPFSQNKNALAKVQKLSGIDILRPLSAKLLPVTEVEKNGLVIRGKLKSISGRNRIEQMELVKKYGIKDFPSPAGGCLLTDPDFCERLNKMLSFWPECRQEDVELLKWGRVFWLLEKDTALGANRKILVIVGRKAEDNEKLAKLAIRGDYMLELKEMMGPTTLIRITDNNEIGTFPDILKLSIPDKLKVSSLQLGEEKQRRKIIDIAGLLTGYYSTKARGKDVEIMVKQIQ